MNELTGTLYFLGVLTGTFFLGTLFLFVYLAAPVKIRPFFKWFDFWIGFYYDTENKVLYFCPLPMVGLKMEKNK